MAAKSAISSGLRRRLFIVRTNKFDELLLTCPRPPIPTPSNLRLIVALCPAQPPSSYVLSVFVSSFKSNIFNHRNAIGSNQWRLDDRCPCTNTRQSTLLGGKMCYLMVRRPHRKEDTEVERVGHGQGRLWRRRSRRLCPLFCRRHLSVAPKQR